MTAPGVEALAAAELLAIGIESGATERGGVEFVATNAELARLAELVEATRNAPLNGFELRVHINHEFHDVITRASRSERLVAMVASFREFFLSERTLEQYDARDSERALAHHTEIVDALVARDGRRVERLVRRHLEHDRRVMKARR